MVGNQFNPNNEGNLENKKLSDYETRKQRSIDMLNSGIEPIKDGSYEYFIPSQTDKNKKYKITISKGWYNCECPDNHKGHLCKHILLLKTYLAMSFKSKQFNNKIQISKCCPYCNSYNIKKDGTRKTTLGKRQRYLCIECNGRFVNEPIKKIKGNSDIVSLVMDLYFKGCSLRDIQDTIRQFNGLKVHHETIRRWINKYMKLITQYTNQLKPNVSEVWHSDEQNVKIKSKDEWLWSWNIIDSETRFLLANQITKERYIDDARKLFRQAKANTNTRPKTIVTDGLQAYRKAVNKEFSVKKNKSGGFAKDRTQHIRLKSIKDNTHNNRIERYHNTFREREKIMRGLQNEKTANEYNENFRTYYNFLRKNNGIGMTPAQASGLEEPNEWKPLLLKSIKKTINNNP